MSSGKMDNAVAVTPSDSANLTNAGTLYVGGAGGGALKVTTTGGDAIAFAGVTAGWFGDLQVQRVWSTGTDVTSIIVAY